MDRSTVAKHTESIFESCLDIQMEKGREYSGHEDALSNFKRGGEALNLAPTTILMVYLTKHMDSIMTYCRDLEHGEYHTTSEPIEGRIKDAINYLILLYCLIQEQREVPLFTPMNTETEEP